jgi:hypothetical protein
MYNPNGLPERLSIINPRIKTNGKLSRMGRQILMKITKGMRRSYMPRNTGM